MVVWCRFRHDIELLKRRFGDKAVVYYGGMTSTEKAAAKDQFLTRDTVQLFLANAASAGTGVDRLQEVTSTAVYYSQSFNSLERWQSEDRTNRIGTQGTSTYTDIIGRKSVDRMIVKNLRAKRDLSDMTLNNLKEMINEC
jgi:SNF2 family DNA or RNA helicase